MSKVASTIGRPAHLVAPSTDTRVGVVIPVFNRRTMLLDTLARVVAQTKQPAQLVVVDDGSTDGTAEAAETWLLSVRPRFEWRVVRSRHVSAAAARNIGFEFVRTLPWVAFLDSDDHWPPDFLARMIFSLCGNPRAVAASADRLFIGRSQCRAGVNSTRQMAANPIPWFFRYGAGIASCTVFSAAAVDRMGGWKPEMEPVEDAALFAEIAREGLWLHVPGEPVAFQVNTACERGEQSNLSRRLDDRHLHWARAFERIYEQASQCETALERGELRRLLAYRWCAAAKQLALLGRVGEAREACGRSLFWCSTYLRAWRWKLRLALAKDMATPRLAC